MLIVDNNPDTRLTLVDVLSGIGYHVVVAATGQEALSLLAVSGEDISAVLIEVSVPVIDGLTLARTLRERGWKKPVILMGDDQEVQHLQNLEPQMSVAWLHVPFGRQALHQAPRSVLHPQDASAARDEQGPTA